MSSLVIARIASRSSTSARPRISSLVAMVSAPVGRLRWLVGRTRRVARAATSRPISCSQGCGAGMGGSSDLEQQEAEADGVAERDERLGVEVGVDAAVGLGRLDELGEAVAAVAHAAPAGTRSTSGRGGRRRTPRAACRAHVLVGVGPALRSTRWLPTILRMSVHAAVERGGRRTARRARRSVRGLDGRLQQLGLAAEAAVDGAGGEAGPAGDLLRRRPGRSPSRRRPRRRRPGGAPPSGSSLGGDRSAERHGHAQSDVIRRR